MTKNTHNTMRKLNFEQLFDLLVKRFISEIGSIKTQEIHNKINTSQKVESYLSEVGYNALRPTSKGIISMLNTVPYFMFSKGETLCIGALFLLTEWNWTFNKESKVLTDYEITNVAADLIIYCYGIKFNKHDSIFPRFFGDIDKIMTAEKRDPSMDLIHNNWELQEQLLSKPFTNLPQRLTFSITNVKVTILKDGNTEYKAVCDNGSTIIFFDHTMDVCIDELDSARGLYAIKEEVIISDDGKLIPKQNLFWDGS